MQLISTQYVDRRTLYGSAYPYPHNVYINYACEPSARERHDARSVQGKLNRLAFHVIGSAKHGWRPATEFSMGIRFAEASDAMRFRLAVNLDDLHAAIAEEYL